MTELDVALLAAAVGTLVGGGIAYLISNSQIKKAHQNALELLQQQEFFHSASKFKSVVIYELSGLYPVRQGWHQENFPRLYESIPRINSAAAEFRSYVTRKDEFDSSIEEYNKYCRETKENDIWTLEFNMKQSNTVKPQDKFKNIVDHLLSFTVKD